MTATPSQRLRLAKQAPGDNFNAWGEVVNTAVIDMVDEAFGFIEIPVAANVTLTSNNYTSDQSRRAVLRFTGAGGFTVTVPAVEKLYLIDNRCAANVMLKTASGASAVIRAGTRVPAYVDAVDTTAVDPTLDKIKAPAAAVALNGQQITGAADATTDTGLATRQQVVGLVAPFATAAASSATAANTSAGAASASATLANQWAVSLTLVDGTYFGARKYAIDAAASAAAAAQFDPSSYYVKSIVDAKDADIRRLASLAIALGG